MTGASSAINILLDVTLTIQGSTGGDDGNATRTLAGSALTFLADKVSVRQGRSLQDHSTAQSGAEFNRTIKLPESVTVETKLEKKANAALLGLLNSANGVVVELVGTSTGADLEFTGIVESIEWDYDGPSTLRFTLRQYGSLMTVGTT